jgi:Tol biopolymer transport system component
MDRKIILFLIIVLITQNLRSQDNKVLDAKFSPLSNIIALKVGDNKNSNIRLYFKDTNELSPKLISDSLKEIIVRDFEFSPEGDKIALLLISHMVTDLFLYNIKSGELSRCTGSDELRKYNINLTYKTNLNWVDNQSIIFLSKHSGLVQQYIYNTTNNIFEVNGSSTGTESFLTYSRKNRESYYVAIIDNKEPSVYRRKLGSTVNIEISKDGYNHVYPKLSDNENYLFYSIMPDNIPCIYDLNESKLIKTELPKSRVRIISFSEKDTTIVYTVYNKNTDLPYNKTDLFKYNYMTQEKQLVSKDIFSVSVSHDGSTLLYTKLSKITAKSPTQFEYKFKDIQLYFPENKANDSNFSDYGFAKDWSRDNKTVLFANENKLVIFNTETNDKKTIKIED